MNLRVLYPKLRQSDIELDVISKQISFYAVNPINIDSEYKKFKSNDSYEPEFHYAPYKTNLLGLRKKIFSVKTDDSEVGKILHDIKRSYLDKTYMLQYRGNAKRFTEFSQRIYGSPDRSLVEAAKKLVKIEPETEDKRYTSKQLISKFKLAFLKYGFPWSVTEKDMVAQAAVQQSSKEIFIKKGSKFSDRFIQRLVVHEIGTHVARAENGEMQPYLFFKRGLPGYLMTEEGLAVLNEELNNCLNKQVLKIYAGRVLAIHKSLTEGFRGTYDYLTQFFTDDMAWKLTLRAKRGLGDSALPGACTKDINYLKGYLALKDYIQQGGDISKLYYGKIGIQHINTIENMPGLINPAFLPMFRHVNYLSQHFTKLIKMLVTIPLTPLRTINNRLYQKLVG